LEDAIDQGSGGAAFSLHDVDTVATALGLPYHWPWSDPAETAGLPAQPTVDTTAERLSAPKEG